MKNVILALSMLVLACASAMANENLDEAINQINQKVTIVHVAKISRALSLGNVLKHSHMGVDADTFSRFTGESCWIAQGLRVSNQYAEQATVSELYDKGKQPNNPFGESPEALLQKMSRSSFELIGVAPRLNEKYPMLRIVYDMGDEQGDEVDYDMGFGIDVAFVFKIAAQDEREYLEAINKLDGNAQNEVSFVEYWLKKSSLDSVRYACTEKKSLTMDDWVWYKLVLDGDQKPAFEDILVPQVNGEPVNLGIVSYLSWDNSRVDVRNMNVAQSEIEAISCAQCHTRNTAFHQWGQTTHPEQKLPMLPIESPFVHLTRNFSHTDMSTIKSRYQISFELYQLRLFQSLLAKWQDKKP